MSASLWSLCCPAASLQGPHLDQGPLEALEAGMLLSVTFADTFTISALASKDSADREGE